MNYKGCFLSGAALLLGGLLVLAVFILRVGSFLTVDDALFQADAIVVLAGNMSRTRHAVNLFNQAHAPVVVFSDAPAIDVGPACSLSAQRWRAAAQELGLPGEVAIISDEAQSTYDEAVNLRRLAQERNWHSLIVVTDPFHTRRAARTFRTLLPGMDIYVSAAPDPRYDPARWWESEDGLVGVFNEVLKLGFYWAKYGIRPF